MHHRSRKNGDEEDEVFEANRGVRGSEIQWAESKHLTSTRDIEMQQTIMAAQLEQERNARSVACGSAVKVVLSDRSAVDPITYAVLTASNENDGRERMGLLVGTAEFQAALGRYRNETFILFKPVPGWQVDDGVRSMDGQDQSLEMFRAVLKELEIPYVELGGEMKDLEARVAFAKRLLAGGRNASLST